MFVSLPKKILLVLLALLCMLAVVLGTLWMQNVQRDFELQQQQIREQSHKQFALLNQLSTSRTESLVEFLANVHSDQQDPVTALAKTLQEEGDYLLLNWQIEQVWLFDAMGQLAYPQQHQEPDFVRTFDQQLREQQRTMYSIECATRCTQIMGVPILVHGEVATLVASLSLTESLAFLAQSSGARFALVYTDAAERLADAIDLQIRGPIASSLQVFFTSLMSKLPAALSVDTLMEQGFQLQIDNEAFLLQLIPLSAETGNRDFLLSAHDITPLVTARKQYQWSVLISGAIFVLLCGVLFYALTNTFRKRLLNLSKRLPLLAERAFDDFHQQKIDASRTFNDELDLLQSSASTLAYQLEALDKSVTEKTQQLERIAMYDSLTGLPNRNMLSHHLRMSLASLARHPGYVAVLFFDLDDFKKVNDSHGHSVGDALLTEAAQRLKELIRDSDLACRFGGDEFVVMLTNIQDTSGCFTVAEKILKTMRDPIGVETARFYVSTSIGIAATNDPEHSVEELISHADIAMYQAKSAGGNCCRMFDQTMSALAKQKVSLETAARDALAAEQFKLALQPQIELSTHRLVGFEALLRWIDPQKGFVSPGEFIPVLENTEFMLTLGYWCIDKAFAILQRFREQGNSELKIAINLSAVQFLDPELIPYLNRKLSETGIPADRLELELTERTLVSDVALTTDIMHQLISLGFLISIDDFGTGYSSLSYLKRMPAQIIKIDRSFINGMTSSRADHQIVASTINMVKNLGMKVIAEGIEDNQQLVMLNALECDMAQGYLIARPIMEDQLDAEIAQNVQAGCWQFDAKQAS